MMVGRERELWTLQRLYARGGFQFPVLFGRRRVGKTYLMSHFAQDKPTIFFTAVEDNAVLNLRNLSREIYAYDQPDADPRLAPLYQDFQTAFEAVFTRATKRQVVFIIDEYPYLAKADASIPSILQALIDRHRESSQLYLILCGSSLSFMREQVLGEKSPLYGRRTAQVELHPLDFQDARRFFPALDPVSAAELYGMAGGVPLYLQQFDDSISVDENIVEAFLDPSSILYEEPVNLLKQEIQKSSAYNAIIEAVASGKTENNEIATSAGIASGDLTYYLKELQRIGLIEKERPVCGGSRRPVYRLSDNLFRFWYRFILPNRSAIERHMPQRVVKLIRGRLSEYMGPVFEQICCEWLWRQNATGTLGDGFDEVGRWWGNNPKKRRQEEIDIVCLADGVPVALGECKWRNEQVGLEVLRVLDERSELVHAPYEAQRFLFSKTGFTEATRELAANDARIHLVSLEEVAG